MATVLSSQKSTYGGPYAFYTVDLTYSNRTETSVTINYTITSNLQYAASYFGYSLTAYLTVAGVSSGAIALKGTEMWSGTASHTKTGSFTVTGLSATTSSLSVSFKVVSGVTGSAAGLDTTTCSSLGISIYAKATTPTLSASSVACAGSLTISTSTRLLSSYTHTLKYTFAGTSGTIATGVGTSYTWTIPASLANQLPGATSGTMTITCYTYNSSGGLVGTSSVTVTITVPSSYKPTISSITVGEAVSKATELFGVYVQDLSQLAVQVNISTSNAYGATVSSYSTIVDGVTYLGQTFTSNVLKTVGTVTITTTIIDSRGRTHSLSTEITVIAYSKPQVDIKVSLSGTTATTTMTGKVAPVSNKNSYALILKYKKTTDTDYTSVAISSTDYSFEVVKDITGIDTSTSYVFVVELTDELYSVSAKDAAGTILFSGFAGGKGIRFFGEAYQEGFMVGDVDYTITAEEYAELEALIASISL